MSAPYVGPERREAEQAWSAFTKQLANLHADVGDIKAGMQDFRDGMKELAAAILKLALVEERQAQAGQAIERCFKLAEKLEVKLDGAIERIVELEKAEPAQNKAAEWVDRAVWAIVSGASMLAASKLGVLG